MKMSIQITYIQQPGKITTATFIYLQFDLLKEMACDLTHILTPEVNSYLFYFVVAQIQVD